MKAADTKDPDAKIEIWDWRYYDNQLEKQKYAVDTEALRDLLPVPKSARRDVQHLPEHLRTEI